MSLLISLAIPPSLLSIDTPIDIIAQFTGFNAFLGKWGGNINFIGWCIGLFVILYLILPFIYKAMNKCPYLTLICLALISTLTRYFLYTTVYRGIEGGTDIVEGIPRWFPLYNLLEFGLGMFIVLKGFYPKNVNNSRLITYLIDLSFYVFLVHVPLLGLQNPISGNNLSMFIIILFFANIVYLTDKKVKAILSGFISRLRHIRSLPVEAMV